MATKEQAAARRAADPEHVRALERAYYYRNREAVRARQAERRGRYTTKPESVKDSAARAARVALNNAVRDGKLVKPEMCDSCNTSCRPQAHHDDYSHPLSVRWLCVACHGVAHRRPF